jgi:hypothetical protein
VRPTSSILEHVLNSARQEFRTVSIAQAKSLSCRIVHIPRGCAIGVSGQVPQHWLDELVIGWNGHVDDRS